VTIAIEFIERSTSSLIGTAPAPSSRMEDHTRRNTLSVVAGLFGESLREMAVLIAVFAPLDAFVRSAGLTVGMVVATITGVLALYGLGVLLEVKRP
jgi:hypothetical protein